MHQVAKAVLLLVLVALGAAAWRFGTFRDPYDNLSLSLPPPLVAGTEVGGRLALFEGRDLSAWEIKGSHRGDDGTLLLGGGEAATAALPRRLEEGDTLEFDFFQEGSAGAKLRFGPELLMPQPPDPDFLHDIVYDLGLAGFAYKRWHHVTARATHEGTNTRLAIEITPHHDGPGRGGNSVHSLPARGGCRYRMSFETGPSSTLSLRNLFVRPAMPPAAK